MSSAARTNTHTHSENSVCLNVTVIFARAPRARTSYGPVSVCLLQVGVLLKWLDGSFFVYGLLSAYPTLCFKEIEVSAKIRVLPSETSSKNADLKIFVSAYRPSKRVIDLAREMGTLRA